MDTALFCRRAIAYVKPSLPESEPATLTLSHAESPVISDLGNGLLALYIVDDDDEFTYVQNAHIDNAGLTPRELHALGCANLGHIAKAGMRVVPHGAIHAVFLDGNFEASLILVEHLWQDTLAEFVDEGFTVALPARDVLAFCDSSASQGIEELREVVGRVYPGGDHLISERLYRRENNHWTALADA